jgi:hypothetical protein
MTFDQWLEDYIAPLEGPPVFHIGDLRAAWNAATNENACTCPWVPGRLHHYDACPQAQAKPKASA